ncbi:MAG: hypothetical protein BroJett029_02540 [Alphaproteobacteria bacterium]|nr:MAG: hypothetical protein BroJett029_02540 [Alphaproteobacteria bacterium]
MPLDLISLCLALAVGFIATGVVNAEAIIPPAPSLAKLAKRVGGLVSGVRLSGNGARGI